VRGIIFGNGEYYHVYNRGVEKRDVFTAQFDYERFLFDVYAMNDQRPFLNSQFHYRGLASIERLAERRAATRERTPWRRLVDVVCFCLLPNHFHLILRQCVDGGLSLFMQKLGTAYTMYFNERYQRSGGLFQGTFKAKHVATDRYFLPLSRYVHLNALDLFESDWRERGIRHVQRARGHLFNYPWSTYRDFVGHQRFPRVVDGTLIRRLVGSPQSYQEYVGRFRPSGLRALSALGLE